MIGQNCHGVTFFVLQIQDVARDHSEILVSGENENNAKKSKILVAGGTREGRRRNVSATVESDVSSSESVCWQHEVVISINENGQAA
jgi:hypothetical protein